MAILNGSYKFHTCPTNYLNVGSITYCVTFKDNEGTIYNFLNIAYLNCTTGQIEGSTENPTKFFNTDGPLHRLYDATPPYNYFTTDYDDVENAPWLILTFDNQEVDNTLYEIKKLDMALYEKYGYEMKFFRPPKGVF